MEESGKVSVWSIRQATWVRVKVLTQGSDINMKTFFLFLLSNGHRVSLLFQFVFF